MGGLGSRIKIAADQIGGLDSLAELIPTMSRRSLSDYVSEKSEPRASLVGEIAQKTHVSAAWLLLGEGGAPDINPGARLRSMVERMSDYADRAGFGASQDDRHMIPLPFYEGVEASAGIGLMPQANARAEAVVSFDERFLRDKGATPERCNVITARGDSMAPTIPDGSLLVVDHSQTQVGNGYIMVINLGDDLLVKRVHRRIDGLIELISDNQAYPRETIGAHMIDQLRVVGRVVYFCRVP